MSGAPSARPSAERMWSLVPGWTRWRDERAPGAGILRGLIDALGVGLDAARDDVVRLLNDVFVETCDPRLIPLIGDLVGASVDPSLPVARQRHQVKYAIHLRRRKGTVEQLQKATWQATGFNVTVKEPPSAQRTVCDPPLSVRVTGAKHALSPSTSIDVTGRIPAGRVKIVMDVAWPVRRSQIMLKMLKKGGPDLHVVNESRAVGLRRADGTPILRSDDPTLLVGPGLPIEVDLVGADFDRLGPLVPRFMQLSGKAPFYVPHRTLAIDPELGRVAGPTAPTPGIQAYRQYRLHFWEPLSLEPFQGKSSASSEALIIGEPVLGRPYPLGDGVYTFAADGRTAALTDPHGLRLRLVFEGDRVSPDLGGDERLLVVVQPSALRHERHSPYVLLEPGASLSKASIGEQGLRLDRPGLNRLFSIEDEWGWDRFRTIKLVTEFGRDIPLDDTVEVDVSSGRFRISPIHSNAKLCVRYFRRFDLAGMKRRGQAAILADLPLNCSATFLLRDTAPGRTEVHRP